MTTIEMSTPDTPGTQAAARNRRRLPALSALGSWSADRILLLVASLLLPAGVVAILLGWYGAAHTPFLFEQIPYLISGGLLGVGLLGAGGLLYFGSWIAKLAEQQRDESEQLRDLLVQIRDELRAGPPVGGGTPVVSRGAPVAAASTLVATATGSMVHRPDCSVVAGKTDLRDVSEFEAGAMKPCKLCNPPPA